MNRYFFLISFLFSAASIATALEGILIVPPVLGLVAWISGFAAMKIVTREMDIFFWTLSVFALFFSVEPTLQTLTWFEVCGICMLGVYLPRIFFLSQMGFLKMIWLDLFFAAAMLGSYITANLITPAGWLGWAIPAYPVFYTSFKTIGLVLDYKAMVPFKEKKFKAEIGTNAPDFSLPDQDGQQIKLSDFNGKNCVLLVFVRGDWCPTCHITLRAYERNKEKFQKNKVTVIAIGPDPVGINKEMVKKLGVSYHILADEKKECANQYGVQLHDNNPMTKYEQGIPLPATFLIGPKGTVEFTSRADHPGEIFNPEDIFPVLEKIAS